MAKKIATLPKKAVVGIAVLAVALLMVSGAAAQKPRPTAKAAEIFKKAYDAHAEGRHAEAVELFEFGLERNPANADAWYFLGGARLAQGNVEGARAAYRRSLDTAAGLNKVRAEDVLEHLDRLAPESLDRLGLRVDKDGLTSLADRLRNYRPQHDRKYKITVTDQSIGRAIGKAGKKKQLEKCGVQVPEWLTEPSDDWTETTNIYVGPTAFTSEWRRETFKCNSGTKAKIQEEPLGGLHLAGARKSDVASQMIQINTGIWPPKRGDTWLTQIKSNGSGFRSEYAQVCRATDVENERWPDMLLKSIPGQNLQSVCENMDRSDYSSGSPHLSVGKSYTFISAEIGSLPLLVELEKSISTDANTSRMDLGKPRIVKVEGALDAVGSALEFEYERTSLHDGNPFSFTKGRVRIERIR